MRPKPQRRCARTPFGALGYLRLISLIAVENRASAAVAARLGMSVEGSMRMHDLDVGIWSLAAPR